LRIRLPSERKGKVEIPASKMGILRTADLEALRVAKATGRRVVDVQLPEFAAEVEECEEDA
jgi:hypothetical protein